MNRRTSLTRHAIATLCGAFIALLGAEPIPAPAPDAARAHAAPRRWIAATAPVLSMRADGFLLGGGHGAAAAATRTP